MWVLVHENMAWQITCEDPTGLWGEDFIWVDIGSNPDKVQETWVASEDKKGGWMFSPPSYLTRTIDDQLRDNQVQYTLLLNKVSIEMTPLLVSLQLGDATQEEVTLAKSWQQYYRDLKAVDLSCASIIWPVAPDSP